MRTRLLLSACLFTALLPLALPAMAAGPDEADAAAEGGKSGGILPEVVVSADRQAAMGYNPKDAVSATRMDMALRDVPQTVNVVPLAVMRDQGALSLQDVMRNIPGIGLSTGDGQRDQVSIRGFSAIADQYVDGLRDDALYFRDLSNLQSVEVVKGPASVLYGRGSSGGLINRITKKPGIDLAEASFRYGGWDDRRGEVDLAHVLPDTGVALRLTGAIEAADSYRQQQFLDRKALAPSAEFNLDEKTKLLVQADYLEDKRVTDFGIPAYHGLPVDVPPGTYYGAANARDADYSQSRVRSTTETLTHEVNDSLSLRNAFRYYRYNLDRRNTLVGSVNEAARTAALTRSIVGRYEHGWFNQSEAVQKFSLAGIDNQLLLGLEVGHQTKDAITYSQGTVATVALFNPVLPTLNPGTFGTVTANNRGLFDTTGVYAQDMVTLLPELKALVGMRFDRFEQRTLQHLANLANLSRTDRNWSPRAGLVWQPTDDKAEVAQSYYVSWSRSFQPSGEAFSVAANNADIAPESTRNVEVGAKLDFWQGRLSTTASLFRLERSGIKTTDPVTQKLLPIGVQRTDGVELTGALDLSDGWKAIAGYAYLDARVTESVAKDAGVPVQGKRATITPRHSTNLWVTKAFGNRFGLGGGMNYVGDRYANPGNTVTLPSYVTVDAMAWYRQGPVTLQVNIYNIADERYIVSAHGSNANLNLPGSPRSVMGSVKISY
ncbi:TonB-dependent receptor [Nitrospirillum pindoramense]|uniref:Catecholate siderophore receptor n=1 Tax=Nitrospirillum amazonense TaxID=28077 RepID=A0A560H7U6_9PROT|nr:TonB-dependent siderophore receptor [Nitrospirillum amazonense]TWB42412.1 catecholate siderophore receptor [Nitrospirillum amazonense]